MLQLVQLLAFSGTYGKSRANLYVSMYAAFLWLYQKLAIFPKKCNMKSIKCVYKIVIMGIDKQIGFCQLMITIICDSALSGPALSCVLDHGVMSPHQGIIYHKTIFISAECTVIVSFYYFRQHKYYSLLNHSRM